MLYDRARNNFLHANQVKANGQESYLKDALYYLSQIREP